MPMMIERIDAVARLKQRDVHCIGDIMYRRKTFVCCH